VIKRRIHIALNSTPIRLPGASYVTTVTRRHTQEDLGTAGLRPLTNFQAVSKTWRLAANVAARPKRVGYSYRNLRNYQRRILSYIAGPRPQRSAA